MRAGHFQHPHRIHRSSGASDSIIPSDARDSAWLTLALLALPILAALGPFASLRPGQEGFPYFYRILLGLIIVPSIIALNRSDFRLYSAPRALLAIAATYVLWGPLSMLWTPDPSRALREIVGAAICMLAACAALFLSRASDRGIALWRLGWIVGFVITTLIAIWEMATSQHLLSYFGKPWIFPRGVIASSFYNPNNYASFLIACLGPLLAAAVTASSVLARWALYSMSALCVVLVVITNSRSGVLGVIAISLVAIVWILRSSLTRAAILLVLSTAVVATDLALSIARSRPALFARMFAPFDKETAAASDILRIDLSLLGLKYFLMSGLMGTGAGSYLYTLKSDPNADIFTKTSAHNTFIEILAQYGIFLALPFVALFAILFSNVAGRPAFTSTNEAIGLRFQIAMGLVALISGGLAASSVFAEPTWWLLLAYVTALAWNHSRIKRAQGNSARAIPSAVQVRTGPSKST